MSRQRDETLEEILHRTIVRNQDASVAQLADKLGVPEYTLYECANANNRRQFPLSRLIALTLATGDDSIIRHVAARCGLVVFKLRKKGKSKLENAEDLLEYQKRFAVLLGSLVEAFKAGGGANCRLKVEKKAVLQEIDKLMSCLAGLRQDVENLSDQLDLGLEE